MAGKNALPLPDELVDIYVANRGILFWKWVSDIKGIKREVVDEFELGYAPRRAIFDIWPTNLNAVPRYNRKGGDTIYQNQYKIPGKMPSTSSGKPGQDTGSSVSIPIRSLNGDLRGFAARYVGFRRGDKDIGGAKYRRWAKALTPYGAYQFAKNNKGTDTVIFVEGYSDLWKVYQAGFRNAISIYGTSGLKSFLKPRGYDATAGAEEFAEIVEGKDIWLFLDGDLAGREATVNQILLLKKANNDNIININNIYAVATPSGRDPGDLSEEEIISLLGSTPMGYKEYIRWWMSMGIDSDDFTQAELLNRQLHRIIGGMT